MNTILRKGFLLLVCCILSQYSFAQNFKATYKLVYLKDSLIKDNFKSEEFSLYLNQSYSSFISVNHRYNDSIKTLLNRGAISRGDIMSDPSLRKTANFEFLVMKSNDITFYESGLYTSHFKYTMPRLLIWNITESTSKIMGYNCVMATTTYGGRNYEAWFTTEIPLSDGPYIFAGLPGLIINIYDTRKQYNFTLQSFVKSDKDVYEYTFLKRAKISSREKVLELRKEYKEDRVSYLQRYHGIRLSDSNDVEQIRKNTRKDNNSIELSW